MPISPLKRDSPEGSNHPNGVVAGYNASARMAGDESRVAGLRRFMTNTCRMGTYFVSELKKDSE